MLSSAGQPQAIQALPAQAEIIPEWKRRVTAVVDDFIFLLGQWKRLKIALSPSLRKGAATVSMLYSLWRVFLLLQWLFLKLMK